MIQRQLDKELLIKYLNFFVEYSNRLLTTGDPLVSEIVSVFRLELNYI
jgi:hypothetical protein